MSFHQLRMVPALIVVSGLGILGARFVSAQAPSGATATKSSPILEGDWVRIDPHGSGNFGGLTSTFTPAALTPEGSALMAAGGRGGQRGRDFNENRVHNVGEPYVVVDRPCGGGFANGALGVNPDSGAIHIIQQKDEVVIAPERGGSRHIYMDGRNHPDLARWTPFASGHGVGHYENGVLVVDTMGFQQGGGVPAGGVRRPQTHLTERFEISPDGQKLTIKYTWTDPQLYQRPHTYEYVLERLPPGSYALEEWCDASDPLEQWSIVPPKQIKQH